MRGRNCIVKLEPGALEDWGGTTVVVVTNFVLWPGLESVASSSTTRGYHKGLDWSGGLDGVRVFRLGCIEGLLIPTLYTTKQDFLLHVY